MRCGNRRKVKNRKYFNDDVINTMTTKDEQIESHFDVHEDQNPTCKDEMMMGVFEYMLAHFNLKQGLELDGERGKKATKKEL